MTIEDGKHDELSPEEKEAELKRQQLEEELGIRERSVVQGEINAAKSKDLREVADENMIPKPLKEPKLTEKDIVADDELNGEKPEVSQESQKIVSKEKLKRGEDQKEADEIQKKLNEYLEPGQK